MAVDAKQIAPGLYAFSSPERLTASARAELIEQWRQAMGPQARLIVTDGGSRIERVDGQDRRAILLADIPQQDLHIGDQVTLLGPVVVGSLVAFAYVLPDGTVPLVPIPADAVRLEPDDG